MRLVAALLSILLLVGCATRGVPSREGIANFGKVNDSLYRGGQPDLRGMQRLNELGVRSVIDLRMANSAWKGEGAAASANSMIYTNIPLRGLSTPTPEELSRVLLAISTMPKPVFIHCRYGCERTGTIIACYRIRQDRWGYSRALEEANTYGLSRFAVNFRKCIQKFGKSSERELLRAETKGIER